MVKITQKHEKEIVALNTFEAVRLRPGMYVSSISHIEEKVPITKEGKLQSIDKRWSPGFMHLIVEILENAIDEAKRMKGKMKNITVIVNTDTNEVIVSDEGNGFHDAASKHQKTKKNVVRTAMEELHAGSNFIDSSTNILGTNGLGSAVVNILSRDFSITTVNNTHYVHYKWKDYVVIEEEIRKKTSKDNKGTTISFVPSPDVFPDFKYDEDLVKTYLSFKSYIVSMDPLIKNLNINGKIITNGISKDIVITKELLPKTNITIKTNFGTISLCSSYENSCSVSFVNGSLCSGIHQKIVNDWFNDFFGYSLAHHFYETIISLNVPSILMRFGDQNKSKYDVTRVEIEELLESNFKQRLLKELKGSNIAKEIEKNIEERMHDENIKKIKKAHKTSKRKISEKYSPATKRKELIFITEGLCISENQKIIIIRNENILECKLKDVKLNDLVITHNNNIKPIKHINKSIKKAVKIKTNIGQIECSEKHEWFVYDKINEKFYFEKTLNLDKTKHLLVKNYLAFLQSFDEIKELKTDDINIIIQTHKNEQIIVTKTNKIAIYNIHKNNFCMIFAEHLKIGDILSKFYLH